MFLHTFWVLTVRCSGVLNKSHTIQWTFFVHLVELSVVFLHTFRALTVRSPGRLNKSHTSKCSSFFAQKQYHWVSTADVTDSRTEMLPSIDVQFAEGSTQRLSRILLLRLLGRDGHVQQPKLVLLCKLRLTRQQLLFPLLGKQNQPIHQSTCRWRN